MKNRFKNSDMAIVCRIALVPILAVIAAACSPVSFSTVNNDGVGVTSGATPPPTVSTTCNVETMYRKTKIMFLVDGSGSNVDYTYNLIDGQDVNTAPSDPAKTFRGGAINNFFTSYQHKTNFNWSFSTFSGNSAQAYIGTTSSPLFSTNSADMGTAIQQFYNSYDSGQTPYAAAIALAAKAIANDPDLNSTAQPNYFIILLSDGFPTDYTDVNGNFKTAQMQADVAALRAKAPGRVTLSTIYYASSNTQIPVAVADLQQMATAGGGQFASVNTSSNTFKIDDVISSNQVCK